MKSQAYFRPHLGVQPRARQWRYAAYASGKLGCTAQKRTQHSRGESGCLGAGEAWRRRIIVEMGVERSGGVEEEEGEEEEEEEEEEGDASKASGGG